MLGPDANEELSALPQISSFNKSCLGPKKRKVREEKIKQVKRRFKKMKIKNTEKEKREKSE